MKLNTPITITVAVVIVALLAAFFTARLLETPEVKMNREVEGLLEQAQQRLNSFDPGGSRTLMTLDATEPAAEQWSEALQTVDDAREPFGKVLSNQEQMLRKIATEYDHLIAPPRRPGQPSADSALRTMQENLQRTEKLIEEALAFASKAVNESNQLGQPHPEATRLKAMLTHTQADLLRRRAALHREVAQNQRIRFMKEHDDWQRTNARLQGADAELNGSGAVVPAVEKAEPVEVAEPVETPAAKPTGQSGILSQALKKAFGREDEPADEDEAEPEGATADEPEPVEREAEEIPDAPPIQDRIAALEKQRTRVRQKLVDTEKDVARLQEIVDDLEQRLTAALKRSTAAQKKMLKLEQKGTDAGDPKSLPGFVEAYEAASQEYREASMEASTLERGALRNTRIDTEDENKLLTAPLVAAEAGQEIAPERGLLAMQHELRIAQRLLEKRSDFIKELDRQFEDSTVRKAGVQQLVADLEQQRDEEATLALNELQSAVASMIEADELETEALTLSETRGPAAVKQAERASDARIRDARTLNNSERKGMDQRLTMMSRDAFTTSHASLIAGDLHVVTAAIYAQRAEDLERHAALLASLEPMEIDAEQALLPEGRTADTVPEAVWQASAADAAAQEAYDNAIAAGEEAIQVYEEIAEKLNDLWVVHANIAAVNYMLAEFVEDPTTAEAYRNRAAQEYERSLRDRMDTPEGKRYQPILQELTQAQ